MSYEGRADPLSLAARRRGVTVRRLAPHRTGQARLWKLSDSKYSSGVKLRDRTSYRTEAEILKALANESRLLIVHRLQKGECNVSELVDLVGLDQSTVSRHLSVLKASGIVRDERRGNSVLYGLALPCVGDFLTCASRAVRERRSQSR